MWLEGQRALGKIDRLEKGHLSFVFSLSEAPSVAPFAGDDIMKHERLPGLWAFMASVSVSTVFHS